MLITIGETYHINFVYKNYPCDCECHTNKNIVHIDACCWDRSYNGLAVCVDTTPDDNFYIFNPINNPNRYICVHKDNVKCLN